MKKIIFTFFLALMSSLACFAYEGSVEIKDYNGKTAGKAIWKSAKGSRISYHDLGNTYTVTIYNDSNEDISGYVTINGMPNDREWKQRHASTILVNISPKKKETVTFYVGEETDDCGYTVVLSRK